MDFSEIVDRHLDEFFWNIINHRSSYLRTEDEDYKNIHTQILDITREKSLRDFFNEKKIKSLSEDDAKIILKYLQLIEEQHAIELKDTFYSAFAVSKDIEDKLNKIRSGII